jgi:hypothetical protein
MHPDLWNAFLKYTVETGSDVMMYISSFIKIRQSKLVAGGKYTNRRPHKPTLGTCAKNVSVFRSRVIFEGERKKKEDFLLHSLALKKMASFYYGFVLLLKFQIS